MNPALSLAIALGVPMGDLLPRPRPQRPEGPAPITRVPSRTLRRRARKGDPEAAAELARREAADG